MDKDDLVSIVEWAIDLGCPPELIPSMPVMQRTLRSRSMILMEMVKKVRPQKEVQLTRENILINRLEKLKDKDLPASYRTLVPERLKRYQRITEVKKSTEEASASVDKLKSQCARAAEIIKEKNIRKMKLQQEYNDAMAKQKLADAKLLLLQEEAKAVRDVERNVNLNRFVRPTSETVDETKAKDCLEMCKMELEGFYNTNLFLNDKTFVNKAKGDLLMSIRTKVQDYSNADLFQGLMSLMEEEITQLSFDQNSFCNRSMGQEKETVIASISDAYLKYIKLLSQIKDDEEFLEKERGRYELFYDELGAFAQQNQDLSIELIQDFLTEFVTTHINEARIKFRTSEIGKTKASIAEKNAKLNELYKSVDVVKESNSLNELKVRELVKDVKQLQKISDQLILLKDITEKNLMLMKGNFLPGLRKNNMTIKAIEENSSKEQTMLDELNLFATMSMDSLNRMDSGQLWRQQAPIFLYKNDLVKLSRSAHLFNAQGFLRQNLNLVDLHKTLESVFKRKSCDFGNIRVDLNEIRLKEKEQTCKILETLSASGQVVEEIEDVMKKCRTYYDFLLNRPLKDFIPSSAKVLGKTYHVIESEYLVFYNMIKGTEKLVEVME